MTYRLEKYRRLRKEKLKERDWESNAERLRVIAEKLEIIQELRAKVDYLTEPVRPIIDSEENLPRTIKILSDSISASKNNDDDEKD
ncbi:hypothetical protein BY996DRAFT_6606088 [Phakopsora pachyrhizi]|nr:hypothetical protein BY996DRAFT_6606088 [Phakopsora pachyrhizi]